MGVVVIVEGLHEVEGDWRVLSSDGMCGGMGRSLSAKVSCMMLGKFRGSTRGLIKGLCGLGVKVIKWERGCREDRVMPLGKFSGVQGC